MIGTVEGIKWVKKLDLHSSRLLSLVAKKRGSGFATLGCSTNLVLDMFGKVFMLELYVGQVVEVGPELLRAHGAAYGAWRYTLTLASLNQETS